MQVSTLGQAISASVLMCRIAEQHRVQTDDRALGSGQSPQSLWNLPLHFSVSGPIGMQSRENPLAHLILSDFPSGFYRIFSGIPDF